MTDAYKVVSIVEDVTPKGVDEKRLAERRADWHTPQDCFKLLATQEMVTELKDSMCDVRDAITGINQRLDKGQNRMDKIEDTIFSNHLEAVTDRKRLEELLQKNTDVTTEIKDILDAGKGFFKAVSRVSGFMRAVILWTLPIATTIISFWYVITGHDGGK